LKTRKNLVAEDTFHSKRRFPVRSSSFISINKKRWLKCKDHEDIKKEKIARELITYIEIAYRMEEDIK